MGGEDLVNVAVDERLKDAFDVRTYRSRISRPIVSRSFCRKQAQKAHNQSRARLKEWVTLHCSGVLLKHFCALCAFLWPAFKNKYASGVCDDVNGIAARTGLAVLWQRAIATTASLDDCVGSLDCARRVCSHQSHRAGASSALGTGDASRAVV